VEEMVNMAAIVMLKSRRKKIDFEKKHSYSMECFFNYKQSIFRKIQINQMIAHLQGKLEKHQHMY
jgi:hypothetical protein